MNKPLISVITVVRNDVSHIEQTMLSVLNQTYPNVEYKVLLDREINIKKKLVVLMSTIKRIF